MTMKYNVWFLDNQTSHGLYDPETYGQWVDQGDGPMGKKSAERIEREIRADFGVRTCVLPDGSVPPVAFTNNCGS